MSSQNREWHLENVNYSSNICNIYYIELNTWVTQNWCYDLKYKSFMPRYSGMNYDLKFIYISFTK